LLDLLRRSLDRREKSLRAALAAVGRNATEEEVYSALGIRRVVRPGSA
jgi:hypothetical protein